MEDNSRTLREKKKNPSECYVVALYSDGFPFSQNKYKFRYLTLFWNGLGESRVKRRAHDEGI